MRETTLCYLIRGGNILLPQKKRGFGAGKLNGTGGKVEKGETVENSLIREIKEEIEVDASLGDLVKVAEIQFSFEGVADWTQRCHAYFLKKWRGEPRETEEMKPEWFPLEAIPYERMWVDDPVWLPAVLSGKKIKASFHFDQSGSHILKHAIDEAVSF